MFFVASFSRGTTTLRRDCASSAAPAAVAALCCSSSTALVGWLAGCCLSLCTVVLPRRGSISAMHYNILHLGRDCNSLLPAFLSVCLYYCCSFCAHVYLFFPMMLHCCLSVIATTAWLRLWGWWKRHDADDEGGGGGGEGIRARHINMEWQHWSKLCARKRRKTKCLLSLLYHHITR